MASCVSSSARQSRGSVPVNASCPCSAPALQGAGGLARRRPRPERLPPKITAAEARTPPIAPAPALNNRVPRPLSTPHSTQPQPQQPQLSQLVPSTPNNPASTTNPKPPPTSNTHLRLLQQDKKQPLSPSTPKHSNTTNLHFIMLAFGQRRKPPPNRSGKPKGCESQIRPFVRSPNAPIFGLRSCNPLPFPVRFALRNSAVQLADDPAQLGPVVPRPDAPHGPRA